MSIAVSAVVNPSRSLLIALTGASLVCMAVGSCLLAGLVTADVYRGPENAAAIISFTFAIFGLRVSRKLRKAHRIDISGSGQIRLIETGDVAHTFNDDIVELLPESTIWPKLMVLRLRTREGVRSTMLVLPDCMNLVAFHRLKVACRWIAAHGARRKG